MFFLTAIMTGARQGELLRLKWAAIDFLKKQLQIIEQGENIKCISNQPGHTNPTTTLNIYAHLIRQDNQEAVGKLENTIFG